MLLAAADGGLRRWARPAMVAARVEPKTSVPKAVEALTEELAVAGAGTGGGALGAGEPQRSQ
jgi:hypothetical protein